MTRDISTKYLYWQDKWHKVKLGTINDWWQDYNNQIILEEINDARKEKTN